MANQTGDILEMLKVVKSKYLYLNNDLKFSWQKITEPIDEIADEQGRNNSFKKHFSTLSEIITGQRSNNPKSEYTIFLYEIFDEVEIRLNKAYLMAGRPLQTRFFELYKNKYEAIQRNEDKKFQKYQPFFSRRYKLSELDVSPFLTSFPIALMSIINKDNYKDYWIRDLEVYQTNIRNASFSREIGSHLQNDEIQEPSEKKERQKVYLGHALSAMSDNICLFYELGRYCRFCEVFDLIPNIYIIDIKWAKNNHSVVNLMKEGFDIDENLFECLSYRRKLYSTLGINCSERGFNNMGMELDNRKVDEAFIEKLSLDYYEASQKLLENSGISSPLNAKSKEKILAIIEDLENKDWVDMPPRIKNDEKLKFLQYIFFEKASKKFLIVLKAVLKTYGRLDLETFRYTFLQRFIQHGYNDYLKLGVESEERLDKMFNIMDRTEDYKSSYSHKAIYFEHYHFAVNAKNEKLDVIPYYFPSGAHAKEFTDTNEAINNAILIFDFNSEERKNKVRNIINKLELNQLSIQMSDFFSFINYFFKGDDFWDWFLNDFVSNFSLELVDSWREYREDSKETLKSFINKLDSPFYNREPIPYYFYPYLFSLETKEIDHSKLRNFYSELIIQILERVEKKMVISEWNNKSKN